MSSEGTKSALPGGLKVGDILFSPTASMTAFSGWLGRNARMQEMVRNGQVSPLSWMRLNAVKATLNFGAGTVGSGAHASISYIHLLMGNIGQSTIGNYFSAPQSQKLMEAPIGKSPWTPANLALAKGEHSFWLDTLHVARTRFLSSPSPAVLNDFVGGLFGSAASVPFRAMIQFSMANASKAVSPSTVISVVGRAGPVGAVCGIVKLGYDIAESKSKLATVD